ncbi:MAG: hypothetical protein HC913_18965 [Microscillaceae bacterium]|nr:hypothetical protein [Microscillaceae bacterium]
MPELPEKRLQTYIEQMLKLQHEHRHGPLRVEELERLAAELGLSQAEQDFIDQKFEDYLYRGKGFLRHRNPEAALAELKQAVLIKPLHRDALYYLAEAFYQKSLTSGRNSNREEARHYAERCLQSDARHEEALRLLNRLYQKPSRFWQKGIFGED